MGGHVPPPGAADAVEAAAHAYLVAVQNAVSTSDKPSVFTIALMGVVKVAQRFGVDWADREAALRQIRGAR